MCSKAFMESHNTVYSQAISWLMHTCANELRYERFSMSVSNTSISISSWLLACLCRLFLPALKKANATRKMEIVFLRYFRA